MIKDMWHHRYQLLVELIGTVLIILCPFTEVKAADNPKNQEPVKYITDKQFEMLYSCKQDYNNDTCLSISIEDAEILMKVAVLEDYTDDVSQAYVMSIILNRVNSPDFPNTVKEVVEQEGQFVKLSDSRYKNAVPDVNSHLALAKIEGRVIQTDFLFYEAVWVKNSWASKNREVELEYGGSRFYK